MKRKSDAGNKQPFVRKKTELVFNPQQRAEFLSGFRKRKQHRKKMAQGQLQRKLKEDARRIKAEAKENLKKLYDSCRAIPELQPGYEEQEDEYDTENVTVKVVELSTSELAKENNWIGENSAHTLEESDDGDEQNKSGNESEVDAINVVPGMQLEGEKKIKKPKANAEVKDASEDGDTTEKQQDSKPKQIKGPVLNLEGVRSKKELNHKLKRYAQKSMKKSQAYKQSVRITQQKQLKKSRRVRHFKEKHMKKKGRTQHAATQGEGGKRKRNRSKME